MVVCSFCINLAKDIQEDYSEKTVWTVIPSKNLPVMVEK